MSWPTRAFDLLFVISGVYSLGCYKNHNFRRTVRTDIKGTNVIQDCINAANKIPRVNFQGIGIRKLGSTYGCYADVSADLRYNLYGPSKNCGSAGLGVQGSNATAVFLFAGD